MDILLNAFQQPSARNVCTLTLSGLGDDSTTEPSLGPLGQAPVPQRLQPPASGQPRAPWLRIIIPLLIVILITGIIIGFIIYSWMHVPPPPSHQIRIAVDLPLSGESASSGLPIAGGVEYAIGQVNSMHILPSGYSLVAYNGQKDDGLQRNPTFSAFYDDQSDPNMGVANVKQAINDGLTAALIGPYNSGVGQKEIPVTNSAPLAQISPANTAPCLTKDNQELNCTAIATSPPTYFRLPATDDVVTNALANFLQTQSYQTAYIAYNTSDAFSKSFGSSFVDAWQKVGGAVAGAYTYSGTPSMQDFEKQFKLINTSPDFLFFAGTQPAAANAIEAMPYASHFSNAAFVGGGGIVLNSFVQAAQGRTVFAGSPLDDTPAAQQFKTNYLSAGYNDYSPYTASASDCVEIVAQAVKMVLNQGILPPRDSSDMQGATTFRQAIIKMIRSITSQGFEPNSPLATNFQSFDSRGDNTNPRVTIYTLNGTVWQSQ
jgi:branched-chain amino acid transport system substrate-binding protein